MERTGTWPSIGCVAYLAKMAFKASVEKSDYVGWYKLSSVKHENAHPLLPLHEHLEGLKIKYLTGATIAYPSVQSVDLWTPFYRLDELFKRFEIEETCTLTIGFLEPPSSVALKKERQRSHIK